MTNLNCHYWGRDRFVLNLGDALVPLILRHLGFGCELRAHPGTFVNAGRTLLVIGSLLNDADLDRIGGSIDVWGCGWRGLALGRENRARVRFHAVRGPETVRGLGLPADTPLGDPGFLMPQIVAPPGEPHGKTLVLPHCLRVATMTPQRRLEATGADRLLSPWVIRASGSPTGAVLRQAASRLRAARTLPMNVHRAVRAIAGARFVLTGSLHGAILSHAYGVPWAAYEDHGIDAPAKWQDLAALLRTDIALVRDVDAGQTWWERAGKHAIRPDLAPLLAAFPYRGSPQQ